MVRISRILMLFIVIIAAISIMGYLTNDFVHPYIDFAGFVGIMVFVAVLYFFLKFFASKAPLLNLIVFMLIIFFQLRLMFLIFVPISFLFFSWITYDSFHTVICTILTLTVLSFLGTIIGTKKSSCQSDNTSVSFRNFYFILFVICVLMQLLMYYSFGYVGATGSGENLNPVYRYLAILCNINVFTFMAIAFAIRTRNGHKWTLLILILFAVYCTFTGSRAGIFEAFIIYLCSLLYFYGDAKIPIRMRQIFIIPLLLVLLLFTIQYSTYLRDKQWFNSSISYNDYVSTSYDNVLAASSGLSYRLSLVEPLYAAMFPPRHDISNIINWKTTIISSVNRIIPGKPFGNIMYHEYAYSMLWLVIPEMQGDNYIGYEWGMFGISWQLFGIWSTVFIFLFSYLLARLVSLFTVRGTAWSNVYGLLFCYANYIWVRNLGIDNFMDRFSKMIILLIINQLAFYVLKGFTVKTKIPLDSETIESV
ncbi:MAG: hypothetical protein GXY34_05920 [Syntrophomonadaceae bacterium]|nr:hypothetical protein [Syntrophomonadaceae bacterium]